MNIINHSILKDQELASSLLEQLKEREIKPALEVKLSGAEDYLTLSKESSALFLEIFSFLAEGKSLTVLSSEAELSTQEAANILNISRPYLVKLLEEGKLPYRKVGTHRRLFLADVISYKQKMEQVRNENLQFLTAQAQELNLGY